MWICKFRLDKDDILYDHCRLKDEGMTYKVPNPCPNDDYCPLFVPVEINGVIKIWRGAGIDIVRIDEERRYGVVDPLTGLIRKWTISRHRHASHKEHTRIKPRG